MTHAEATAALVVDHGEEIVTQPGGRQYVAYHRYLAPLPAGWVRLDGDTTNAGTWEDVQAPDGSLWRRHSEASFTYGWEDAWVSGPYDPD